METTEFAPIEYPWGDIDEKATQDAFIDFVGGTAKADRLQLLNMNSYPMGTALDRLNGRGKTKEQVFRRKAKNAGYTDRQVTAFLML